MNEQEEFDKKWNNSSPENEEAEEKQREIDKEKELKEFDKNYAKKYLN